MWICSFKIRLFATKINLKCQCSWYFFYWSKLCILQILKLSGSIEHLWYIRKHIINFTPQKGFGKNCVSFPRWISGGRRKAVTAEKQSASWWSLALLQNEGLPVTICDIVVSVKAADSCCSCWATEVTHLGAAVCFCCHFIHSVALPGEICARLKILFWVSKLWELWGIFFVMLQRNDLMPHGSNSSLQLFVYLKALKPEAI